MRPMSLEVIVPPVAVPSPSAENLYNGLLHSPFSARAHAHVRKMCGMVDIPICIRETDAASSNLKLFAHLLKTDDAAAYSDLKLCHLHQNHLVLTAVAAMMGGTSDRKQTVP